MSKDEKCKVIVIDDDEIVNEVLNFILSEKYEVYNYYSVEDALKDNKIFESNVIITDVNLPGINGIDFINIVHSKNENIPIIVITAYNDIEVAISALKAGAFDFILKPFKNDQIELAVERAYERYRLIKQNEELFEELKKKNEELEKLYQQIQARNEEIENELDIASNLQQCLFPAEFPKIDEFRFALKYKPVEKISGDFFDFIIHDKKAFSFVFADVSGHGVPAALYSALVKSALSGIVNEKKGPSQILDEMNHFLIQSQKTMSYNYVTLFYGYFDLEKNKIKYANAGIPSPLIISRGGEIQKLEPTGPFVGIFETSKYITKIAELKKGDKLLFFSDGAFECPDKFDRIMGEKRFQNLIYENIDRQIDDLVVYLFKKVKEFCSEEQFVDDVTILGMEYKKN